MPTPAMQDYCSNCGLNFNSCHLTRYRNTDYCTICLDNMTQTQSELDPNGLGQHDSGAKMDACKPDLTYLCQFPRALRAVCLVSMYGANKYTERGWENVPDGTRRYFAAEMRHALPIQGYLDEESGLMHDAHKAWNALAMLEMQLREAPNLLQEMQEELLNQLKAGQ